MNRTLLVVTNEPVYAKLVEEIARQFNEQVITRSDGQSGLDVLAQQRIDLIVCDVELPGMCGIAFHQAVAQDVRLAHIPFVFVTGTTDIDTLRSVRNIPNVRLIPTSNLVELFTQLLQS